MKSCKSGVFTLSNPSRILVVSRSIQRRDSSCQLTVQQARYAHEQGEHDAQCSRQLGLTNVPIELELSRKLAELVDVCAGACK